MIPDVKIAVYVGLGELDWTNELEPLRESIVQFPLAINENLSLPACCAGRYILHTIVVDSPTLKIYDFARESPESGVADMGF